MKIALGLMLALVFFVAGSVHAQSTLSQLQSDTVSSWLGTIEGDAKGRTLRIKGVSQKTDEIFVLEADYGFFDGKQTSIKAEISQIGQERKLTLVTQSDSLIVATQAPNGAFVGTFTLKNGVTKPIRIDKISETDLQVKVSAAQRSASVLTPPEADVPATCAAFFGLWSGVWSQGNFGTLWLRVAGVDANCIAKITYSGGIIETTEIKQGVLSFLCNKSTRGTCNFERHGDDLWGSYHNPAGGTNNGVFRKTK